MKQIIRLKELDLYKVISTQSADGDFIKTYEFVKSYKVEREELRDTLSATIYGSDINKVMRFSSLRNELESYLYTKLNNSNDNISKYQVKFEDNYYKIEDLTRKYVDVKRL